MSGSGTRAESAQYTKDAGGVLVRLDDVRRPLAAVERWQRAHARLRHLREVAHSRVNARPRTPEEVGSWAVETYSFKQREAMDLLLDLGWQHDRFYALHGANAQWHALSQEVMDAVECAGSLLEMEPGSAGGEKLLSSLVRRVPALNRVLHQVATGKEPMAAKSH